MLVTAIKLFTLLDARARRHIGLLIVPMLIAALLEMLSIGLVLPLIQVLLSGGQSASMAPFWAFFPDVAVSDRLHFMSVLFVGAFLVKSVIYLAIMHLINRVIHAKSAEFSQRLFDLYLYRPLRFHLTRNSAEIVRNLTTGANRAFEAIRIVMTIGLEIVLVLATAVLLIAVEPMATLVAGATLFLIAYVYYRLSSPIYERWGSAVHVLDAQIIKSVNQALGSIRDVKILHCEDALSGNFGTLTQNKALYISHSATIQHVPRLALESLMVIGFVAVTFSLLASNVALNDVISTLGLFGMASLRLMPSMSRIMQGTGDFSNRTAFVDAIHQDLVDGINDTERTSTLGESGALEFRRSLVLDHLTFTHPNAESPALTDVNLVIARGDSVGIVGASGAGKTTLMDVIMGLLKPDAGSLQVDGVDVAVRMGAWQRHIGYVPQQVYLNDDTMRRNITFGLPDGALNDAQIAEIVRMAQLEDVVAGLPNGLDTILGERGVRLSGGERQRVAIARALNRDPDVLVFDEATSALDNETEQSITRAIESLWGKKTVFVIAHRLSTVRACSKLIYMQHGRIVAVDTFDNLVASNPEFRRLAELGGFSDGAPMPESLR